MIGTEGWNELETLRARVLVLEAALAESRSPLMQDASIAHIVRAADRAYRLAGEQCARERRMLDAIGRLFDACRAAQPYVRGEMRRLAELGVQTGYIGHIVGVMAEALDSAEAVLAEARDAAR